MDTECNAMTMPGDTGAITFELGSFEGFNFRQQSAILNRTARQVVEWNCDEAGDAEFWRSGDDAGVALVFRKQVVRAILFSPSHAAILPAFPQTGKVPGWAVPHKRCLKCELRCGGSHGFFANIVRHLSKLSTVYHCDMI